MSVRFETVPTLPLVDGDLSICGVPISKAAPADLARRNSIARERQRAAIWLHGEESVWSHVVTHT